MSRQRSCLSILSLFHVLFEQGGSRTVAQALRAAVISFINKSDEYKREHKGKVMQFCSSVFCWGIFSLFGYADAM